MESSVLSSNCSKDKAHSLVYLGLGQSLNTHLLCLIEAAEGKTHHLRWENKSEYKAGTAEVCLGVCVSADLFIHFHSLPDINQEAVNLFTYLTNESYVTNKSCGFVFVLMTFKPLAHILYLQIFSVSVWGFEILYCCHSTWFGLYDYYAFEIESLCKQKHNPRPRRGGRSKLYSKNPLRDKHFSLLFLIIPLGFRGGWTVF